MENIQSSTFFADKEIETKRGEVTTPLLVSIQSWKESNHGPLGYQK